DDRRRLTAFDAARHKDECRHGLPPRKEGSGRLVRSCADETSAPLLRSPYTPVVQSTAPLLLNATSERVAVPPDVAAGTTTLRYVPPEKAPIGSACPAKSFVHATVPLAVESAVIVVVNVPSAFFVSDADSRLPSESSSRPRSAIVAVQATAPVERIATTSTDPVVADAFVT